MVKCEGAQDLHILHILMLIDNSQLLHKFLKILPDTAIYYSGWLLGKQQLFKIFGLILTLLKQCGYEFVCNFIKKEKISQKM